MKSESLASAQNDLIELSDAGKLPKKPIISVLVLAYNHGAFLAEAIESILSQRVNFTFELIIGEDFSSDNTREIAFEYQKRFPHLIRVLLSESNVGMNRNLLRLLVAANGKFVAICEGDDYWMHTEKLAMQLAVFERRKELTLLFTDRVVHANGEATIARYAHRDYGLLDVMEGFIPPTQTMIWRNAPELKQLVATHLNNPSGDRLIAYFCAQRGVIGHLALCTAAYRITGSGVWSSVDDSMRRRLTYQNLRNFHKMLGANDTDALSRCSKRLLLDVCHDIKNSRGKLMDNVSDLIFFSRMLGYWRASQTVMEKVLEVR